MSSIFKVFLTWLGEWGFKKLYSLYLDWQEKKKESKRKKTARDIIMKRIEEAKTPEEKQRAIEDLANNMP